MIIIRKQPTLPQNTSADGHNGFGREYADDIFV